MLTRLKVKGFKNLLDVNADFGPFTCIMGANGIGKSNVFDVIEFLSHLASGTLVDASQRVRGAAGIRGSDPRDLFWDGYSGHPRNIELAAEMLVPRAVEDDLGAQTEASTTFLRYEVSLGFEAPEGRGSIGRLVLLGESLTHITKGKAAGHLPFAHSAKNFRETVVVGARYGGAFLSTEHTENGTIINMHGDGGSRGRPQPVAAARAGRTVLSTVTQSDYPTILAARREMQSWRRLALEPSAMREPDEFRAPQSIDPSGRHLAAALFRIAASPGANGDVDPESVYARVAGRLSDLTGVGVESLDVEIDDKRDIFTLFLDERGQLRLPARALSEGTLRFLALCVLLEDPAFTGLICMEEPENGIHPENLPAMVELVRDLAVDADRQPGGDNPFRQVIINTHSPGVMQLSGNENLLLAETRSVRVEGGRTARALSLAPYRGTWRAVTSPRSFSLADVLPYLTAPTDAQLTLPLDLVG